MFRIAIILSTLVGVFGATISNGLLPQLDGRIVGGSAASISSYPWQISLLRNGAHICGGSIYSNNIIITAAHCVYNANAATLRIRAGSSIWSSGGVLVQVAALKAHEYYNPSTMVNDIAVLRLASPLGFSSNIRSISLTQRLPAHGAKAVVTGWGTLYSGAYELPSNLQSVELNIVREATCASGQYGYGSAVRPTMICATASGKDSCQGDSGGPLVSNGLLVGVVSWGYGCAYPGYPGVYSCVASLRSWVINAARSV